MYILEDDSKCNSIKRECLYLRNIITKHGIKPDKSKVTAVLD